MDRPVAPLGPAGRLLQHRKESAYAQVENAALHPDPPPDGAAGRRRGGDAAKPALKRVEAKKVCMVNDQLFEKDQIPVAFEGKTYYGCCEMCKERLAKDAAARTAVDPVTGKKVDKATAVIAAPPQGKVLYFESEKTLAEYQKQ
jgi:YHS domain-containing protein